MTATSYIFLACMILGGVIYAGALAWTRRAQKVDPPPIPRKGYAVATCPLCGKYDPSRPFLSYAIECHRDDCADTRRP